MIGQVFSTFLETLADVLLVHANDIPPEWLYICLSRLLVKIGSDQLLGSVAAKVQTALEAVRYLMLLLVPFLILLFLCFSMEPNHEFTIVDCYDGRRN